MNNIQYREDRFSINYVLKENFEDNESFLVNDKFLNSLNEAEKISLADNAAGNALKSSRKRLEYLNKKGVYGDIPKTKGVVTKSECYKTIKSIFNLLDGILEPAKGANANEARKAYQACKFAMTNLENNRDYFVTAYNNNDSKIILLYQNIYAALVATLAIIVVDCVYIDENCNMTYQDIKKGTFDKSKVMKQIHNFNDTCRNNKLPGIKKFNEMMDEFDEYMMFNEASSNEFQKTINNGLKSAINLFKSFKSPKSAYKKVSDIYANIGNTEETRKSPGGGAKFAAGLTVLAGLTAVTIGIIYVCRFLIAFFFYWKNDVAQSADYLGNVVYANSLSNEHDPTKSGKVAEKQKKLAIKLKKVGAVLDSDYKQAQHNASLTIKKEDKNATKTIEDRINPDQNVGGGADTDSLFI